MAENIKETQKIQERITFEKREQLKIDNERALAADVELDKTTTLSDIIKERKKQEQALRKEYRTGARDLQKQVDDLIKRKEAGEKIDGRTIEGLNRQIDKKKATAEFDKDTLFTEQQKTELLKDATPFIENQASGIKDMADNLEGFVKKLPGGKFLADGLGITGLGEKLEKEVTEEMANHILNLGKDGMDATGVLNVGFDKARTIMRGVANQAARFSKILFRMMVANPILALVAAAVALFTIIRNVRSMQRKFAEEVGISRDQVGALAIKTKAVAAGFNAIGLDGSKIQTTLKEIVSEFGSLENVTVANAANIERFAQNAGIAGTEIVKFNKVMMDLTGASFDVATNMAEAAAEVAKSANVSASKVLGDMSSAAEKFASFSMQGATGMAQAATEAAKVGSSLDKILTAADTLLNFEDSITKQFEAQVLTGKQINTERARQLALDGDIAGLTSEIQSIVGSVGDIQTLNVIQRKSIAEAIGISVQDLLRISRGEQAQQQVTVQDKLDVTNKLLANQEGDRKAILEATINNQDINIREGVY